MNRCTLGHKFKRNDAATVILATSGSSGLTIHGRWCDRCEQYIIPPLSKRHMSALMRAGDLTYKYPPD